MVASDQSSLSVQILNLHLTIVTSYILIIDLEVPPHCCIILV